MHDEILGSADSGVPGDGKVLSRLKKIVIRKYPLHAPEQQATIVVLALTYYTVLEQDLKRSLYAELKRADHPNLQAAWKALTSKKQLEDYCEMAERYLSQMLQQKQEAARHVIYDALDQHFDTITRKLANLEADATALGVAQENNSKGIAYLSEIAEKQETANAEARKLKHIIREELSPVRLLIGKPLQSICTSAIVILVGVVALMLIHKFEPNMADIVRVKLEALAHALSSNPQIANGQ